MAILRRSPLDQVRCCGFLPAPRLRWGLRGLIVGWPSAKPTAAGWLKVVTLRLRCDRMANPLAEGRRKDIDWLCSNYCSNVSRKIAILLNGDVERLCRGIRKCMSLLAKKALFPSLSLFWLRKVGRPRFPSFILNHKHPITLPKESLL